MKLQEHASKNNKWYLKRKTDLKKVANKSASSIAVVDRAKRELQLYWFLFWLNDYLKPYRVKSSVQAEAINDIRNSR